MPKPILKILRNQDLKNKVCVIIGTRPGIVMFSPIIRELERRRVNFFVIHTGQHYSYNMDRQFFKDLKLKEPRYKLNSVRYCRFHGEQTARMLEGCEKIMLKERPKIVLVGGDANTNLAGALAARKLHIRLGHVEAGERSFDWRMPEEHNRRIIDHISDYLFVTGREGKKNLLDEKVQGRIFITGNPIVDAAYQNLEIALNQQDNDRPRREKYCLVTLHREENVDYRENLFSIFDGLAETSKKINIPMILFTHPRTLKRMRQFGLEKKIKGYGNLRIKEAVGYLAFLNMLSKTALVFTDSGGVQQEACILKVPCVTLRENTEWVETLQLGCNTLAGTDPDRILKAAQKMLKVKRNWANPFGNGKTAEKIVRIVIRNLKK